MVGIDYERLEIIVRSDILDDLHKNYDIKTIVFNAVLSDEGIEVTGPDFAFLYHPVTYEQLAGVGGYEPTD